jgi:endonuclease/exonuclease/phosphatase family metal-dependent hydrolase
MKAARAFLLVIALTIAFASDALSLGDGTVIRITTWNLEWFPNGSPKTIPAEEQAKRIAAAADVLRPLDSDILLLQEVRDYDACARLAEAIRPHTYRVAICSAFKGGKQQVAILGKEPAQAAWAEPWKSMEGVDPPRGLAFAWFKIGNESIGVYSLHLKSNLIMHGNEEVETAKNIRKREVAASQLLNHLRDVIATAIPSIKAVIIGGDFNTNKDQAMFASEKTLSTLTDAGFRNCMEDLPLPKRVTHPGNHGYPDATFDYLFSVNAASRSPLITVSGVSDHHPVTCDFTIKKENE